jgi:dCTP deaminase
MILTDREIKKAPAAGLIVIDPPPVSYDSTTVDLTLDRQIRIFRPITAGLIIDPCMPGYKVRELIEGVTDPLDIPDHGWELQCGTLILGWTRERVELNLKGKVAGRIEGKSGLARIGLGIHVTAPTIHAGFVGTIQLEMINHGPMPIKLRPLMGICQLILETTKGMASNAYRGQFSGQTAKESNYPQN